MSSNNSNTSNDNTTAPPRVVLEIDKSYLSFSAGHFTMFSADNREHLHGHNWTLSCHAEAAVANTGLCFDYGTLKQQLMALCDELDERVLLPTKSPWLEVWQEDNRCHARFAGEVMSLPLRDVLLLPIANITVEELAHWFLAKLLDTPVIRDNSILGLVVKVSSGPGQRAAAQWQPAPGPATNSAKD